MKKYEQAELELIRFNLNDVLVQSTQEAGALEEEVTGDGPELD